MNSLAETPQGRESLPARGSVTSAAGVGLFPKPAAFLVDPIEYAWEHTHTVPLPESLRAQRGIGYAMSNPPPPPAKVGMPRGTAASRRKVQMV